MRLNPSLAARATALRRIVRGQYGQASPSTVTSQAKRTSSGCHGTRVYEDVSGTASMSGEAGVWPIGPAAKPANPAPSSSRSSIACDRHQLGVRLAVHLDELREEELDPLVLRALADLVVRHSDASRSCRFAMASIPSPWLHARNAPGACDTRRGRHDASAHQPLPCTRARRRLRVGATCSRFTARCRGYAPTPLRVAARRGCCARTRQGAGSRTRTGASACPRSRSAGASWALERLLASRPGRALRMGCERGQSRSRRRTRRGSAGPGRAHLLARGDERGARCGDRSPRAPRSFASPASTRTRSLRLPKAERAPGAATLADVAYDESDPGPAVGVGRLLDDLRRGRRAGGCALRRRALPDRRGRRSPRPRSASPATRSRRPSAIGVEPATAACATASLAAGRPVVVDTPGTSMAGTQLRHALARRLAGAARRPRGLRRDRRRRVARGDARPRRTGHRRRRLRRSVAGRAARARARSRCAEPLARAAGLGRTSRVLLISTEGATDPVSYAETMERTMRLDDASQLAAASRRRRRSRPRASRCARPARSPRRSSQRPACSRPTPDSEAEQARANDLRAELLATAERDVAAFYAVLEARRNGGDEREAWAVAALVLRDAAALLAETRFLAEDVAGAAAPHCAASLSPRPCSRPAPSAPRWRWRRWTRSSA